MRILVLTTLLALSGSAHSSPKTVSPRKVEASHTDKFMFDARQKLQEIDAYPRAFSAADAETVNQFIFIMLSLGEFHDLKPLEARRTTEDICDSLLVHERYIRNLLGTKSRDRTGLLRPLTIMKALRAKLSSLSLEPQARIASIFGEQNGPLVWALTDPANRDRITKPLVEILPPYLVVDE